MPEQEDRSIRVRLTAEDYIGFNRYHGRWQLTVLFLFYWVIFVVIASMRGAVNAGSLGIAIPAGLLLSALLMALHLWSIKVKTRKLFENDKQAQLEQQIELTEETIRHTTGETTIRLQWADVYKAVETSNAIILYLARNNAIVIPKRDVADLTTMKETLRRHLPTAKLRLNS